MSRSSEGMDDQAYLNLACQVPLPEEDICESSAAAPFNGSPAVNSLNSNLEHVSLSSPPVSSPASRRPKRRAPPAEISIFQDSATTTVRPPKRSATGRKDGRLPLGERKDFGNTCPRTPTTPVSFVPSVEEWNRHRHHFIPPTPPRTPRERPNRQARNVPTRVKVVTKPGEPKDQRLYHFLELHDWRASTEEIKSAYRSVAKQYHPDKVSPAQKEDAHSMMVLINAARDVLLNKAARMKYHRDGQLPHVFVE